MTTDQTETTATRICKCPGCEEYPRRLPDEGDLFWLTGPCPAWCTGGHTSRDMPGDRIHYGNRVHVPMTLERAVEWGGMNGSPLQYFPEAVTMFLSQDVREVGPHVWIGRGDTRVGFELTLDEVRHLAERLAELVEAAQ